MVSARVESEGCEVGLLYRESTRDPGDSGWRVFCGDEDGAFLADATNLRCTTVKAVREQFPELACLLARSAPCAFERDAAGVLQEVSAKLSGVSWAEREEGA